MNKYSSALVTKQNSNGCERQQRSNVAIGLGQIPIDIRVKKGAGKTKEKREDTLLFGGSIPIASKR